MYKVRFHLAQGPNFMKWQVTNLDDDTVEYFSTEENLLMLNGKLVNNENTAKRILQGSHKTVCAWIECGRIIRTNPLSAPLSWSHVKYNPRKCVNWHTESDANLDNSKFKIGYTNGNQVFVKGLSNERE